MPVQRFSGITVASSGYNSDSYLVATSTIGTTQDIRFSFAQISGAIIGTAFGRTPVAVSQLPNSSAVPGARACVLDSTVSSTNYSVTILGGGGFTAPVYSDGSTSWRIG